MPVIALFMEGLPCRLPHCLRLLNFALPAIMPHGINSGKALTTLPCFPLNGMTTATALRRVGKAKRNPQSRC
jgi:hypothetical protein